MLLILPAVIDLILALIEECYCIHVAPANTVAWSNRKAATLQGYTPCSHLMRIVDVHEVCNKHGIG